MRDILYTIQDQRGSEDTDNTEVEHTALMTQEWRI